MSTRTELGETLLKAGTRAARAFARSHDGKPGGQPASEPVAPSESEEKQPTTGQFQTAADPASARAKQEKKKEQERVTHASGYYINENGDWVWTNAPQQDMGDFLNDFLYMLLFLFTDQERFAMILDRREGDGYVDPVFQEFRESEAGQVILNPTNSKRNMSMNDFMKSYYGNPKIAALLDHIARYEAVNGSYESIWGGKIKPGLTTTSIKKVIEWQREPHKGSRAAGRYQFMPDTLEGLVKNLNLTGEEPLSREMQDRLAIELMREKGLDGVINGSKSVNDFIDGFANIWQAFKNSQGVGPIDNGLGHASVSPEETEAVVRPLVGLSPPN